MATWQRAGPSLPDSLYLLKGSKLRKNHENNYPQASRRGIGMDSRKQMCKANEKGDK